MAIQQLSDSEINAIADRIIENEAMLAQLLRLMYGRVLRQMVAYVATMAEEDDQA